MIQSILVFVMVGGVGFFAGLVVAFAMMGPQAGQLQVMEENVALVTIADEAFHSLPANQTEQVRDRIKHRLREYGYSEMNLATPQGVILNYDD